MKNGVSRELYEYWERVRGPDPAPLRSAIEPSDIRRILPDTFILEAVDRQTYNVRLAGTRVCSIYGREIKGTNFLDLWRDDDRSAMATMAAAVSEDGAGAVVTLEGRTGRDDHDVVCELLLLPLRNGVKAFDRLLGSLAPLDCPYWLGIDPVVRQTIASLRLIWPTTPPRFLRRRRTDREAAGTVLHLGPEQPLADGNLRKHGHLYVVDGGKT